MHSATGVCRRKAKLSAVCKAEMSASPGCDLTGRAGCGLGGDEQVRHTAHRGAVRSGVRPPHDRATGRRRALGGQATGRGTGLLRLRPTNTWTASGRSSPFGPTGHFNFARQPDIPTRLQQRFGDGGCRHGPRALGGDGAAPTARRHEAGCESASRNEHRVRGHRTVCSKLHASGLSDGAYLSIGFWKRVMKRKCPDFAVLGRAFPESEVCANV